MIEVCYMPNRKLWLVEEKGIALGYSYIGFGCAKSAAIDEVESRITDCHRELKLLGELLIECVELKKPEGAIK